MRLRVFPVVYLMAFLGFALAGCTSNVTVAAPSISPTEFASASKLPGRYAVYLQSGGWNKEIKTEGFTCSAWSFPTNFDQGYIQAAQSGFSQSFANVDFVQSTLSPEELKANGYDAQVFVYEGNMGAKFGVIQGFWTGSITVDVEFEGIVAVANADGLKSQGQIRGTGHGTNNNVVSCDTAGPAIQQAGGKAITDFVVEAINAAKLNILELQVNERAAAPTS